MLCTAASYSSQCAEQTGSFVVTDTMTYAKHSFCSFAEVHASLLLTHCDGHIVWWQTCAPLHAFHRWPSTDDILAANSAARWLWPGSYLQDHPHHMCVHCTTLGMKTIPKTSGYLLTLAQHDRVCYISNYYSNCNCYSNKHRMTRASMPVLLFNVNDLRHHLTYTAVLYLALKTLCKPLWAL